MAIVSDLGAHGTVYPPQASANSSIQTSREGQEPRSTAWASASRVFERDQNMLNAVQAEAA
jgi:hypothetical protein